MSSMVLIRSHNFLKGLFLVLCAFGSLTQAQQVSEGPLTNDSVVKLVKAGFKEKTIIAIIHSRPNQFKLDTEALIQLKRQGISENVILAMLSQNESFEIADSEWSDNSFFRDPNKGADNNSGAQDSGTNIFGLGGSSRSRTQSRSGNGATQTEGDITGSATVRILRPPTEAGGTSSKLEKTPTLNNESIVRLVEAGFSEGTIIKRIEQSPVEFDLTPAKLDELRRQRVTEPIIVAMSAAMGGGDEPKPTPVRKRPEQ